MTELQKLTREIFIASVSKNVSCRDDLRCTAQRDALANAIESAKLFLAWLDTFEKETV